MGLKNAAVFINGRRHTRNVDVAWEDDKVIVHRRNRPDLVLETFDVIETASTGQAWDIRDGRGERVRLVAQEGCGCSGIIKPYENDEGYSGALTNK